MENLSEKLSKQIELPDMARVIKIPVKPDKMAILVAKAVVYVLSSPRFRHLMEPNVLESQLAFLANVVHSDSLRAKYAKPGYRDFYDKWEQRCFPGLSAHFVLRKRRIEELARQAIQAGFTQVVSFGAGFDTLLPRLATEYPEVCCIEVDLPSTQKPKSAVLKVKPKNLHFIGLNLQEPFLDRVMLSGECYDPKKVTFFIAEGVLMFLDDEDVDNVFSFMYDHSPQYSRLVFTFLERGLDSKAMLPEVGFLGDLLLRLKRIKVGWGVKHELVARFMNDRYFGLLELNSAQDLRDRAPEPIPAINKRARVEFMAVGELVFTE